MGQPDRASLNATSALGVAALGAAFDQLATMVAIVHPQGQCLLANSALEDALGLSRRALQRSDAFDWFADAAPLREHVRMVAGNEVATSRFEAMLKRAPGGAGERPVHVIVSQLDPAGERE